MIILPAYNNVIDKVGIMKKIMRNFYLPVFDFIGSLQVLLLDTPQDFPNVLRCILQVCNSHLYIKKIESAR